MTFPAIALLSSSYLLFAIIYFGGKIPYYRHLKNTISELGEVRSPVEKIVDYGVFLPIGLLLLLLSLLLYLPGLQNDAQTALCGLSASVGASYAVAAFFPCDPGSPFTGSNRQQIHNLGGVVKIHWRGLFSNCKLPSFDINPGLYNNFSSRCHVPFNLLRMAWSYPALD